MLCKMIKSNKHWLVIIGIGLITLIFGATSHIYLSDISNNIDMLLGMFSGFGFSFLLVGLINIIRIKRSPETKLKEKEIEMKDERNIQITRIANSVSYFVAMMILTILSFLFVGLNYPVPAFITVGALLILGMTNIIAYRYYNKKM